MSVLERGAIVVNDRRFPADFRLFKREPLQSNVQVQDAGAEPSERSLSRFGWKRSQTDFVYGAGQEWFDQEDENDRRRFYASKGLTMGTRGTLTAVGVPTVVQSHVGTVTHIKTASAGYTYWSVGVTVYRLGALGTTTTTCTGTSGNTITGMAVIGGFVYVCDGTDIRRATDGGTAFSTFGALAADGFVTGNNRLLGFDANFISEIDKVGAKFNTNDIFEHPYVGFTWKGGVNAPNGIYLWGDDGVNSEIFLVVPTDATGELAYPYPATAWPTGELVNAMEEYGGVVAIATTRGVRLATINGSGFLSYGPVREASGDTDVLIDGGESFWFGWSTATVDGTSYSGLGRLGMDRFTSTLAASYELFLAETANTGTALAGAAAYPTSGSLNPSPLIAVSSGGTLYLYGEHATTLETTLVLDIGKITYGTPESKALISFMVDIEGLADDDTVAMVVTVDGTATTLSGKNEGNGIWRFTYSGSVSGYTLRPVLTVTLGTPAAHASVAVQRWTMRCLVLPEQVEIIECGIILDKETASDGYSVEHRDPLADFEYLHGLAESKDVVKIEVGDRIDHGYVDAFTAGTEMMEDNLAAGETGTFLEGLWILRAVVSSDVAT